MTTIKALSPTAKQVVEVLANTLVEDHKWPKDKAAAAAEGLICIFSQNPAEFKRYEALPPKEQRDLWFYFATGWNQGRLFARRSNN